MTPGELVRVQKYLSMCGVCSRRKAEEAIGRGDVTIDGGAAKIGQSVAIGKNLGSFCGESIVQRKKKAPLVLALHKPRGYVCTHCDQHRSKSENIYALLPMYKDKKLVCCGRLDVGSEGLVILTDDGDLAAKLMHPSKSVEKFYNVRIDKPLEDAHRKKLIEGIVDGEELLKIN